MSSCVPSTFYPNYRYPHHQIYESSINGLKQSNSIQNSNQISLPYSLPTPTSKNNLSTGGSATDTSLVDLSGANILRSVPKSTSLMSVSVATSFKTNSKKRQRSRGPREPDWHTFYKNGLPKEIIVIDDSPTPEPSSSLLSKSNPSITEKENKHPAKKRRRDNVKSIFDPVYHAGPSTETPGYKNTPSYKDSPGSTASTARTNSAAFVTAATSLGSLSSNGQNNYEISENQFGQKRRRAATRLQIANEAKRREVELNADAFINYIPPPRPPIKAPDVQVKQVPDVSDDTLYKPKLLTNKIRIRTMKLVKLMILTVIILLCPTHI